MIKRVLQLNVRLSEGGAAGVARTLADELNARGIESPFAYGYGPHGRSSPIESEYGGVRLTTAPVAALNKVSFSLLGVDTPFITPQSEARLKNEIALADVVHLHVVHSYMLSSSRLIKWLVEAGKPVVWTLHDQWVMTGRCAQPGSCRRWESGCTVCPNLDAYPPARVDNAATRWQSRRASIEYLQSQLPTAIVSCAEWLAVEAEIAGIKNIQVVKNSVDSEFFREVTEQGRVRQGVKPRVMFMCRDLRDPNKVDWKLLERLAGYSEISLTVIGDNAPTALLGARRRPAVTDRREIAQTYLMNDRLVFTSTVDYFPLTIVEAVTAGVEVYAVRSRAAEELLAHPLVQMFDTIDELEHAIVRDPPRSRLHEAGSGVYDSPDYFNPARMANEYLGIYEALADRSS